MVRMMPYSMAWMLYLVNLKAKRSALANP